MLTSAPDPLPDYDAQYEALEDSWGQNPALQWSWLSPYWVAKFKELGIPIVIQLDMFSPQYVTCHGVALGWSPN